MNRVRKSATISLMLGVMSVLAIGISHLALTDIWHGESAVSLEWNVLRFAAMVIIVFHVFTLATLWQVLRRSREACPS